MRNRVCKIPDFLKSVFRYCNNFNTGIAGILKLNKYSEFLVGSLKNVRVSCFITYPLFAFSLTSFLLLEIWSVMLENVSKKFLKIFQRNFGCFSTFSRFKKSIICMGVSNLLGVSDQNRKVA